MDTPLPSHLEPTLLNALLTLRDYLQQLYQERFVHLVLFGSHARGEASTNSDVDILIVLNDPVNTSQELHHTSQFVASCASIIIC